LSNTRTSFGVHDFVVLAEGTTAALPPSSDPSEKLELDLLIADARRVIFVAAPVCVEQVHGFGFERCLWYAWALFEAGVTST
jgi:hypothetical protein